MSDELLVARCTGIELGYRVKSQWLAEVLQKDDMASLHAYTLSDQGVLTNVITPQPIT